VLGLALTLGATACLDPDAAGNLVPATVDEDPSLPRIEVNGTALHAEAFGNPGAPMIMVLHGGPGGDYRSLLPYRALAGDGYYVVYWDHRGAGLSRRHPASSYSLVQYLEDLRQVIERFSSSNDLVLRAGNARATALEQQTMPFYLTVGVNVTL
jgi:proline iminopeptidase